MLSSAVAVMVLSGLIASSPTVAGRDLSAAAPVPRILYTSDRSGPTQIYAVDPAGKAPLAQVTFGRAVECFGFYAPRWLACGFFQPVASPDGRRIAYVAGTQAQLWVSGVDGRGARLVGGSDPAWSPDSSRIAHVAGSSVRVARADGSGDRAVAEGGGRLRSPAWSSDGRALAFLDGKGVLVWRDGRVRRVTSGGYVPTGWDESLLSWSPDGRRLAFVGDPEWRTGEWPPSIAVNVIAVDGTSAAVRKIGVGTAPAWSPDGRRLAYASPAGLRVVDARTWRARLVARDAAYEAKQLPYVRPLGFAWAPDSRSLAYLAGTIHRSGDAIDSRPGDLRVVTLAGTTRTVVDGDGPGRSPIISVGWLPASGARLRSPEIVQGVYANGPVIGLAADGGRAVFASCGRVWAWTPSAGAPVRVDQPAAARFPSMYEPDERGCAPRGSFSDLALAGDRVAYTVFVGNMGRSWGLDGVRLGSPIVPFTLDWTQAAAGVPMTSVVGGGELLVFAPTPELVPGQAENVSRQRLRRAGPAGCPCSDLVEAQRPGGLYEGRVLEPLDVDAGRILAARFDYLFIYDPEGNPKLAIDVRPDQAALGGDAIVVAVGSELRHYDAVTGALRGRWTASAAPASVDTARGLAAYVTGARVIVRRLADGTEREIGYGTLARFNDQGLVVADGTRVRLIDFVTLQSP